MTSEKSSAAYARIDAYLADLVDILRGEVEELIRLGCTYIQIDSRNIPRCWIRICAKATASAATIPTGCSIFRSRWITP